MSMHTYQTHKAIGILGGTFDPIHLGHLRMAIELYQALDLANVHIMPTNEPIYRKAPVASPAQRMQMVRLAVEHEPALFADDREIRRGGATYTIDTLLEMRAEMPDIPFCLLLGIDAFLGFTSWHRYQEILSHAHLIIAHRPHYQLPLQGRIAEIVKQHQQKEISFIHENLVGGILLRPITALEISATDIRKQIAMGRNPRYLLPDNVYEYIRQDGIYGV